MRNLILSSLFSLILAPAIMAADIPAKVTLDEAGICLNGNCKAVASAPDGSAYVLMKDCRLIRVDVDGAITEIKVPLNKEIKTMDDYFCDMVVDTKAAYFCGYNYSSVITLDLSNPKELKSLNVKYDNKEIKPLRISKSFEGWTLSDDSNTYKIDKTGKATVLPENSQIVLDGSDNAVISVYPFEENGKTVYPGKLLNQDKSVKWTAPTPHQPKVVMGIEYLGYDTDRKRDVYLVNSASGDMDVKFTIYAVDSNNKIVSKRNIPISNIETLMRFCKLASDGSILAVYAEPNDPDGKVLLKRFELKTQTTEEQEVESKG